MKEDFDQFQKELWSNSTPLLFAIEYVKELMAQNEKLRLTLNQLLSEKREEFLEDIRSKCDFSNFEK